MLSGRPTGIRAAARRRREPDLRVRRERSATCRRSPSTDAGLQTSRRRAPSRAPESSRRSEPSCTRISRLIMRRMPRLRPVVNCRRDRAAVVRGRVSGPGHVGNPEAGRHVERSARPRAHRDAGVRRSAAGPRRRHARARQGKVVQLDAIDSRTSPRSGRMKTDTLFQVASMTKPDPSTAVMMLVRGRKLLLTDASPKFIPPSRIPSCRAVPPSARSRFAIC